MRPVAPIDLYFLTIIAIIRITSWFPYRSVRRAVAGVLGRLSHRLSRAKRTAVAHAVATAFRGRLSDRDLKRIVQGTFTDFWFEMLAVIPNAVDAEAVGRAEVIGWEHLEGALAAGKGAIIWESANFGRRGWLRQILDRRGVRVHQVHGSDHIGSLKIESADGTWVRRKIIRRFFEEAEAPFVAEMLFLPSGRELAYGRSFLSLLRDNRVLCVAADGGVGTKLVELPFLEFTHHFASGMVSLARAAGAPLVPVLCRETEEGRACLIVEEAIEVSGSGDRDREVLQSLRRYVAFLERYVLDEPAAYRNWHTLAEVQEHLARGETKRGLHWRRAEPGL